jgi:hypothetical protein
MDSIQILTPSQPNTVITHANIINDYPLSKEESLYTAQEEIIQQFQPIFDQINWNSNIQCYNSSANSHTTIKLSLVERVELRVWSSFGATIHNPRTWLIFQPSADNNQSLKLTEQDLWKLTIRPILSNSINNRSRNLLHHNLVNLSSLKRWSKIDEQAMDDHSKSLILYFGAQRELAIKFRVTNCDITNSEEIYELIEIRHHTSAVNILQSLQ